MQERFERMKYTIEKTENGCTEMIELDNDKKYIKRWEGVSYGCTALDKDFCEQMEDDGIKDEDFLDEIYALYDNVLVALDFIKLSKYSVR